MKEKGQNIEFEDELNKLKVGSKPCSKKKKAKENICTFRNEQ